MGHANPAFTLRVYAHAMRDEEADLSFAEFDGSKRPYPAPASDGSERAFSKPLQGLVELVGLEPTTLRLPA